MRFREFLEVSDKVLGVSWRFSVPDQCFSYLAALFEEFSSEIVRSEFLLVGHSCQVLV